MLFFSSAKRNGELKGTKDKARREMGREMERSKKRKPCARLDNERRAQIYGVPIFMRRNG